MASSSIRFLVYFVLVYQFTVSALPGKTSENLFDALNVNNIQVHISLRFDLEIVILNEAACYKFAYFQVASVP